MTTKGIWVLSDVYLKQLTGQWATAAYVPAFPQPFGWVAGGQFSGGSNSSRIDRIDYANDLNFASVRSALSAGRYGTSATGNDDYGWVGGGSGPMSTVDRIDYTNDLTTPSVRGPLSFARFGTAATGNLDFGWFGGGHATGYVYATARIERVTYSNDAVSAVILGDLLSVARRFPAAVGNAEYGWFSGGLTPNTISSVHRLDFSNDQTVASVRGPMNSTRFTHAAVGNANFGWMVEGSNGSTNTTLIDRITYSNDTASASIRGVTDTVRSSIAGTGSESFGWFSGGRTTQGTLSSVVVRITYSSDTGALMRGPLSDARAQSSSTGGFPG